MSGLTVFTPNTEVHIRDMQGTFLAEGGVLSINGGNPALFDISDGHGVITDAHTDPHNPISVEVNWSGLTGEIVTNLATQPFTFVYIDIDGLIVQRPAEITLEESRDLIKIGGLLHGSLVQIEAVNNAAFIGGIELVNTINDLGLTLGTINSGGNLYAPSLVTPNSLKMLKNFGQVFVAGGNYKTNRKNPNLLDIPAADAVFFNPLYQDGAGGTTVLALTDLIDPTKWDDGSGVLATVANNKFTVQRITLTGAGTGIEYGQAVYDKIEEALAALSTEAFNSAGLLHPGGLFRAWLVLKKETTDLSIATDARFIAAGKFGSGAASSASNSTTSLQQAYNNSTDPETVLATAPGAMTVRNATGDSLTKIQEWTNNAGTIDYMVIKKTQIEMIKAIIAGTLTIDGNSIVGNGPITITAALLNPVTIGSRMISKVTGHASFTATGTLAFTGIASTAIPWNAQVMLDTLVMSHSITVNNTEVVFDAAGTYFIACLVLFTLTASSLGAHSLVAEVDSGAGFTPVKRSTGSCITTTSGSATSNTANSHWFYTAAAGDKLRYVGANILAGTNSVSSGPFRNLSIRLLGN